MGILTGKGVNAQRKLFSRQTNYDDEIHDLSTTPRERFIHRAVVVDVIFDPVTTLAKLREAYAGDSMLHPELLETAPRNSIIGRVITDGADKRSPMMSIFYPAHSHTHEPIKPGEQVFVFYENPGSREYGFWLSRICEPIDIDDPNFTHADRKFIDQRQPSTVDRLEEAKAFEGLPDDVKARLKAASSEGPQFPNGGDTSESYSLAAIDDYEKIEQLSFANVIITKEPVPRYSKRPADWAAQGSNNSLIVLGEDRTGATVKLEGNDLKRPDKDRIDGQAGMFDIVTGRGVGEARRLPSPEEKPTSKTAPWAIKNARNKIETNKELAKAQGNEGDPDFEFDATRIYGAMDTDVDGNFGKPLPKLNDNRTPDAINAGAAAVVKSNHIRVISREDGSIRIVKEGVEDDETGKGRAVIIIEADGTIMIDGPHIIMGSGIEKDNGAGTQVYLGRDATEPLVMGNILKTLLNEYTSAVNNHVASFADALDVSLTPFTVAPGNFGNLGAPIPGVTGIANAVKSASSKMKDSVKTSTDTFQGKIDTVLSRVGRTK